MSYLFAMETTNTLDTNLAKVHHTFSTVGVYYSCLLLSISYHAHYTALYYFHDIYQYDPPGNAPLSESDPLAKWPHSLHR